MLHGLSAIRGARNRTTFVLPPGSRRERRLGPHGPLRVSPGAGGAGDTSARRPLDAVRSAARSAAIEDRRGRARATDLGARARLRWSPVRRQLRDPRTSGSALWRG
jgi:hypothetical protein